jgi:hypothetical protein
MDQSWPEVLLHQQCVTCHKVAIEAFGFSTCAHLVCQKCIQGPMQYIENTKKSCPHCRIGGGTTLVPNVYARNDIARISVPCKCLPTGSGITFGQNGRSWQDHVVQCQIFQDFNKAQDKDKDKSPSSPSQEVQQNKSDGDSDNKQDDNKTKNCDETSALLLSNLNQRLSLMESRVQEMEKTEESKTCQHIFTDDGKEIITQRWIYRPHGDNKEHLDDQLWEMTSGNRSIANGYYVTFGIAKSQDDDDDEAPSSSSSDDNNDDDDNKGIEYHLVVDFTASESTFKYPIPFEWKLELLDDTQSPVFTRQECRKNTPRALSGRKKTVPRVQGVAPLPINHKRLIPGKMYIARFTVEQQPTRLPTSSAVSSPRFHRRRDMSKCR